MRFEEEALRLAKRFTRRVDIEDKDDLRQEIIIAVWKASERFDPAKGNWSDYAYQTAFHAVREYYRQHPRIGKKWLRSVDSGFDTVEFDETFGKAYYQEHEHLELTDYLCQLSIKEQRIVMLLLAGYQLNEIASYLNIGHATIYRTIEYLRIKSSSSSFTHHTDSHQLRQAS